jgi:hypothetical protein
MVFLWPVCSASGVGEGNNADVGDGVGGVWVGETDGDDSQFVIIAVAKISRKMHNVFFIIAISL